jgi:arginine:agmatine antiporter
MIKDRKLGPLLATVVVAGNMIGSGVFLLPATLASVGSVTVIGWVIATAGALVLALLFSRLARRSPEPGGPPSYVHASLGPMAGFNASLWYWLSCVVGNVAIAAAAAGYLSALVPVLSSGMMLAATTAALIGLVTILNLVSPRFVGQIDGLLLVTGLVPLVLIATAGWAYFDPALFRAEWNPGGKPLLEVVPQSLVLVFWAFLGLESACVCAAVVREPEKNIPIATVAGVLFAGLVYIAVSTAMLGIVPAHELAASAAPFALAATKILGTGVGALIAAAAMFKALGTLAGWVLLTAQATRAAGERGHLPRVVAKVTHGDVPVVGLVIALVVGSACAFLSVSATLGQQFGLLVEAATIFSLLTYAFACAGAVRNGDGTDKLLGIIGAAFCVVVIAYSTAPVLRAAMYCVLVIFVFGVRKALWQRHHNPEPAKAVIPD